ncbi:hypothetical protein HYS47_01565 [Candidatus Woesearchaeota archaeon]|nr:hypothetical protein [Candidatus Woesearchaeota archaeon]
MGDEILLSDQEDHHEEEELGKIAEQEIQRRRGRANTWNGFLEAADRALEDGRLQSAITLYEQAGAYQDAAKAAERSGQYSRAIYNYMRSGNQQDAEFIVQLLREGRL